MRQKYKVIKKYLSSIIQSRMKFFFLGGGLLCKNLGIYKFVYIVITNLNFFLYGEQPGFNSYEFKFKLNVYSKQPRFNFATN